MARITPQTARLLADEMIKAGRARVNDRDSLIQSLLARSEATGDAAPETAIGAALMAAQPRTLTPAATAQPGVPFVAPKATVQELPVAAQMAAQPQAQEAPVAPQRPAPRSSRYRPMLNAALADLGAAQDAMAGQEPDKMAQIRIEALRGKAQQLQDLVQAEEGQEAEIPEEMRAAMEGRQARLARREELLAEAKARSPFEALIAGGAALAQGRRGERFTEALTRGLQAGIMDYGRARRANEEGAESVAEARDQAMIDRYNMQERARDAALQRARDIVGMGRETREEAIREVRLPTQLSAEQAAADEAVTKAKFAPEREAAGIKKDLDYAAYLRGEGRQTGGGGATNTTKGLSTLLTSLDREAVQLGRVTTSLTTPSKDKFAAAQRLAEVNAERKRIRAAIAAGRLGDGATPAATASSADEATHVYVPGRGPVPIR
jgi:hypothetical protein